MPWTCLNCNETAPGNFLQCWNCGTGKDGQPADRRRVDDPPPTASPGLQRPSTRSRKHSGPRYLAAALVWFLFCCAVVAACAGFTEILPSSLINQLLVVATVFLAGLITAVAVNVLGELGSIIQEHFFSADSQLMGPDPDDHQSSGSQPPGSRPLPLVQLTVDPKLNRTPVNKNRPRSHRQNDES